MIRVNQITPLHIPHTYPNNYLRFHTALDTAFYFIQQVWAVAKLSQHSARSYFSYFFHGATLLSICYTSHYVWSPQSYPTKVFYSALRSTFLFFSITANPKVTKIYKVFELIQLIVAKCVEKFIPLILSQFALFFLKSCSIQNMENSNTLTFAQSFKLRVTLVTFNIITDISYMRIKERVNQFFFPAYSRDVFFPPSLRRDLSFDPFTYFREKRRFTFPSSRGDVRLDSRHNTVSLPPILGPWDKVHSWNPEYKIALVEKADGECIALQIVDERLLTELSITNAASLGSITPTLQACIQLTRENSDPFLTNCILTYHLGPIHRISYRAIQISEDTKTFTINSHSIPNFNSSEMDT